MRLERLIAAFFVAGCSTVPTVTPSELNAQASKYNGQEVHVRGWLVFRFEDVGLWDSKNARDEMSREIRHLKVRTPPYFETCVSYVGPDLGRHFESRYLVLDGIYRKNTDPPGAYIVGVCNASFLEIKRLPAELRQ